MRDRLSRTEGQLKIEAERANLLEAALDQARSQIRTLECTVQEQHDQVKEAISVLTYKVNVRFEELIKPCERLWQVKKI